MASELLSEGEEHGAGVRWILRLSFHSPQSLRGPAPRPGSGEQQAHGSVEYDSRPQEKPYKLTLLPDLVFFA
jgi:hypothetical protein